MHKLVLFLVVLTSQLTALGTKVWVGPQFEYTRIDFNNPSDQDGFVIGVTAGGEVESGPFFANAEFEGTWNVGPLKGSHCQNGAFLEYLLDGRIGFIWCVGQFSIKPYTGFGWDRFENIQENELYYNYRKLFVPVGFYAMYCPCSALRGGFQFECRCDVSSRLNVVEENFDLRNKLAFRVQLPLECVRSRFLSFALVPFYDWNKFGRCAKQRIPLDIPELTHWSIGVKVLACVQF